MKIEINKTFPRTKDGILAAYKYVHAFDDEWCWFALEAYIGKDSVIEAIQDYTDMECEELENLTLNELFEIVSENEIPNCYRTNEELAELLEDPCVWEIDESDESLKEYYDYVMENAGDVFEEDYIALIA